MSDQLDLFDGGRGTRTTDAVEADRAARAFAVDPREHVVLEASAGTGKTSVLVARYLNLLKAGVAPANILAITFTRKAAAEMHERIVSELRAASTRSPADRARWLDLRDRLGEVAIETIDAFCLSLLREFPLEAGLDPGFEMADETEVPRILDQALDQALRIAISVARKDPDVALVLTQLGTARARTGLARLLGRRLVAGDILRRALAQGGRDLSAESACRRAAEDVRVALEGVEGGLTTFVANGPVRHPKFLLLAATLGDLARLADAPPAVIRLALDRIRSHFLTLDNRPRTAQIHPYTAKDSRSVDAWRRHRAVVASVAPRIRDVLLRFDRDLNGVLTRGLARMFGIAETQYRRALHARSQLDFAGLVEGALALLGQMDEFAQSRFRLESRYHHVLVDEFQDTSRAQWDLIALLIRSWGEGVGLVHDAPLEPTIFVVGDRKQSIYRFRDAQVGLLDPAARFIESLRPGGRPRRSISRSFRAVPALLEFVNDVFDEVDKTGRPDSFDYDERDRFPVESDGQPGPDLHPPVLGVIAGDSVDVCARAVAAEIARLLREGTIRDRSTGLARQVRAGDVAILFRSRASHLEFERALETRGIPSYVYKGLGFFDADETKDLTALLRYLAEPSSNLRAAAFLRSRVVRISDAGLAALAPDLADALTEPVTPSGAGALGAEDRAVLEEARANVAEWLALVDRMPPADLLDRVLSDSAYAYELRGPRRHQAWENVKKMRALARRIQNRGYATLARIAEYVDCLHTGDESNAVLDAVDAVNLMTVHASKGLEFPIVFVVNLTKGAGGPAPPVRVTADAADVSVSVGSYVSASDEDETAREREETKRLMYVALTRARDRLYLSAVLKGGAFTPRRGGLGDVMPPSLGRILEAAGMPDGPAEIAWTSTSQRRHRFQVCRLDASAVATSGPVTPASGRTDAFVSRGPEPPGPLTTVTDAVGAQSEGSPAPGPDDDRLVGALVHRLLQYAGRRDPSGLQTLADDLLDPAEAVSRRDSIIERAIALYLRLTAREEVRAVLAGGRCLFEVPFSLWSPEDTSAAGGPASRTVRGTIDGLVEASDGSVVVVELKTGAPRPEHQSQLEFYVTAARALYPGRAVRGVLWYA